MVNISYFLLLPKNHYLCPMKSLEQIIEPITAELQQFEIFFDKTLKADTEPMDSIMRYVLDTRGKRLRPILVLLGAKMFGEINEQTLRAATFVEMVHSATLIHDDVVDDSDSRRKKASVKARFSKLSAVLAGDYLLAKAMLLLAHPDDYAILQEMLRTTAAMSEGELMQSCPCHSEAFEGLDTLALQARYDMPSKAEANLWATRYLDIITRKTAMLMRSCCVAGALSVGATPEQVQQIARFGLNFGILFQLRDDLIDGENTSIAKALMPTYYEKNLKTLEGFAPSEITESLRELTVFCAERGE